MFVAARRSETDGFKVQKRSQFEGTIAALKHGAADVYWLVLTNYLNEKKDKAAFTPLWTTAAGFFTAWSEQIQTTVSERDWDWVPLQQISGPRHDYWYLDTERLKHQLCVTVSGPSSLLQAHERQVKLPDESAIGTDAKPEILSTTGKRPSQSSHRRQSKSRRQGQILSAVEQDDVKIEAIKLAKASAFLGSSTDARPCHDLRYERDAGDMADFLLVADPQVDPASNSGWRWRDT